MATFNGRASGVSIDLRRGATLFALDESSDKATRGPDERHQRLQDGLGGLLSPTWTAWVWAVHGLLGVVIGFVLLNQLGASASTIRTLVSLWALLTAGATAWRWYLDGRRERYLLNAAVIGLAAGMLVLLAGGLSLTLVKWAIGVFWIAAGVLELIAWLQRPSPAIEWPWIAGFTAFVGLVTITWPTTLTTDFTVIAGVWAILLGILHLIRWLWLATHRGELATPVSHHSLAVRILLIALPVVLVAVPVLLYGTYLAGSIVEGSRQAALNAFYQPPANLAPGAPGSIVRIEPVSTPGVHGRGWRILFRSQDVEGNMTISSGVVYAPTATGSNRFVVAWSHGTVGLAPQCAPSRQTADSALVPWVNDMLDRGWVVTAPDYFGAGGTGGPDATELYVIGAEQGRDLLNGVRAARNIAGAGAGTHFAIYGHSQGGAVALWGASLAPTYTPELTLVAVGAVSAASDVGGILHEQWTSPLVGWILGPMAAYPWSRYYNLSVSGILTPAGMNHYQEMALNNCITDAGPALLNPTMGTFFAKDPGTDPNWRKAFIANQAPLVSKGIPTFIGHGLSDTLINPAFSAWLVTRYCANGTPVVRDWLPGVGHGEAAIDAEPQYGKWLANIVAGQTPTSDCGKPLPIAPAQPLT
jgi:pimeloyl-ACP methyl ester carboxylesterase/uncharacterized membrane protein HdeD (DUF308 family)